MSRSARRFGHLRSLVHGPPSSTSWGTICRLLAGWEDEELHAMMDYVESHLSHWPDVYRCSNKSVHHKHQAFRLVRCVVGANQLIKAIHSPYRKVITHVVFTNDGYSESIWQSFATPEVLHDLTHIEISNDFAHKNRTNWRKLLDILVVHDAQLTALTHLHLDNGSVYTEVETLFYGAAWWRQLISLRSCSPLSTSFSGRTLFETLSRQNAPLLTTLHWQNENITFSSEEVSALLSLTCFSALSALSLPCDLHPEHVPLLAKFGRRFTSLSIGSMTSAAAQVLVQSDAFTSLNALSLSCAGWCSQAFVALMASAQSLNRLELSDASFHNMSFDHQWIAPLHTLNLTRIDGVEGFWPHFFQEDCSNTLSHLSVIDGQAAGDDFVDVLLSSEVGPLKTLCIKGQRISLDAFARLVTNEKLASLERFQYTDFGVKTEYYDVLFEDGVIPRTCQVKMYGKGRGGRQIDRRIQKHFNRY